MRLSKSMFKSLQQRVLFPIFTGFPIMTKSVLIQYTIPAQKYINCEHWSRYKKMVL